jgi:hypothetical protein
VSGLGEREGSWELKDLAAGGSVSSVSEQIFFEIYAKKKFPSNSLPDAHKKIPSNFRTLRVRNAQARPEPSIFHLDLEISVPDNKGAESDSFPQLTHKWAMNYITRNTPNCW